MEPIARACSIAAIVVLIAAFPAGAATGSRYLTLDSPAYEGIRILHEAGYLVGLNPLLQPYRRDHVATEVQALDVDAVPARLRQWALLLKEEFAAEDGTWGVWGEGGAHGSTSDRRDPLRGLGDEENVWVFGRLAGWVVAGPVVAEAVVLSDRYLDQDPDGLDPQRRVARTENAYVSATFPAGEIVVGRLARNWGRIGETGLLVGNHATTYPQIGFALRTGHFSLHSFVGELETLGPVDSVAAHKRYLAAHRIDFAWPDLVLSLRESILFASERSGLSLRHFNPVEVFYLESDAEPEDLVQNLMLDASVWWRRGRVELYAEGVLDDIDLSPPEGSDREPMSYAWSAGARLRTGGPIVGAQYTQVSAWAYRTPNEIDRYSFLGRGLGENFSDFDRLSVWADVHGLLPGLRLTPAVDVLRQGAGNFRDVFPPYDQYLAAEAFLLDPVQRTVRLALRGRYQPVRWFWAGWDVGPNLVRHTRGDTDPQDETHFEAAADAGIRLDLLPRP